MTTESTQRLAAALRDLQMIDQAYECVTTFAIPGLLQALSSGDEAEVGRLLVRAVREEVRAIVDEAIEDEQDRAQAMDEAENAEALPMDLMHELRVWVKANPLVRPLNPVNQTNEE